MEITVIGTGYVGLVTGACLAEMGHSVTCVDVDAEKIRALRRGRVPIYEPGLETIVRSNQREGRLRFSMSFAQAVSNSRVHFIAVGTPCDRDGGASVDGTFAVAKEIGRHLSGYSVVGIKSTVPVGTADKICAVIQKELDLRGEHFSFDVASNPEFLKEGAAVRDFMHPDRIIIGCESEKASEILRDLYAPFNRHGERVLFMGVREAEMTKYAANAMLATKISFMNEIATLCDLINVDIESVREGIGADPRIGHDFISPGCGYGGSCFPKDVKALIRTAAQHGLDAQLLKAVQARNELQKKALFAKIERFFQSSLAGRTFALWGLAFKPGTDDMRDAPAVVLIDQLIEAGARVRAYDPAAGEGANRSLPKAWLDSGQVVLSRHQYDALQDADAMVLVTEWNVFRYPDFNAMKRLMRCPVIFDGRNQYDTEELKAVGFSYFAIGRGEPLSEPAVSKGTIAV